MFYARQLKQYLCPCLLSWISAILNSSHARLVQEVAAATLRTKKELAEQDTLSVPTDELQVSLNYAFLGSNADATVRRGGRSNDVVNANNHNTAAATSAGVALVAGFVENVPRCSSDSRSYHTHCC